MAKVGTAQTLTHPRSSFWWDLIPEWQVSEHTCLIYRLDTINDQICSDAFLYQIGKKQSILSLITDANTKLIEQKFWCFHLARSHEAEHTSLTYRLRLGSRADYLLQTPDSDLQSSLLAQCDSMTQMTRWSQMSPRGLIYTNSVGHLVTTNWHSPVIK